MFLKSVNKTKSESGFVESFQTALSFPPFRCNKHKMRSKTREKKVIPRLDFILFDRVSN